MTGPALLAGPALSSVLAAKGEAAKAGPIGLAIIIALGIVCYFLFKSMSKHMRRVRDEFPTEDPPANPAGAGPVPTAQAGADTPPPAGEAPHTSPGASES